MSQQYHQKIDRGFSESELSDLLKASNSSKITSDFEINTLVDDIDEKERSFFIETENFIQNSKSDAEFIELFRNGGKY